MTQVSTNRDQLVALSVLGEIAPPTLRQNYRIQPVTGRPVQLPSVGGIAYNANLGDPAVGIQADHIEPGVSIRHPQDGANRALNTFACLGNRARVVSGEAKGAEGRVMGKHGGVEHVMIHFDDPKILERLVIGDRMQIKAIGTGLSLTDFPEITVLNLDPAVLEKLARQATVSGLAAFDCPVTHRVPAYLLGAGLGEETCQSGDVDIQLFDDEAVQEYGLNSLRFGDLIAMEDCDHRYGRIYRKGWLSIGVVTHSCSIQAGHGPGVTTILTGPAKILQYQTDPSANLLTYL